MAELVDALDSKSGEHLLVPVQVRPAVPETASDGKTAPFAFWLGRVFNVDLLIFRRLEGLKLPYSSFACISVTLLYLDALQIDYMAAYTVEIQVLLSHKLDPEGAFLDNSKGRRYIQALPRRHKDW